MGIQDSRDQNQVAKSRHLSMISGLGVITPLLRARCTSIHIYICTHVPTAHHNTNERLLLRVAKPNKTAVAVN